MPSKELVEMWGDNMAYLIVQEGALKETVYRLEKEKTLIGRDPGCDISLADPAVSRKHAEVRKIKNDFLIIDLNSRNGTMVNGKNVIKETRLEFVDEITLGDSTLIFTDKEPISKEEINPVKILKDEESLQKTILSITSVDRRLKPLVENRERLFILYNLSQEISSTLDLNELLKKIMEALFNSLEIDRGFIMLVDKETGKLIPKVVQKKNQELDKGEITVSQTIINQVLKEGESILSSDAMIDSRFKESESIQTQQIRSVMCVPFKTKDKILGILQVDTRLSQKAFTEEDLSLLSAIANQAAVAIENALLHQEISLENKRLSRVLGLKQRIVGDSPKMQELFQIIRKVTATDAIILLKGESGTGKELVARSIHYGSSRKTKPFVCVNCAALPETLLESELFGHEKGAFTGAASRMLGRFEIAQGGTIFLDEIGEISPNIQVKLLRVIEGYGFERLGGGETIKPNVRIIAATNQDLEKRIMEGRFREDLYYRLKVIEIKLPPLRERKEDIPQLVNYFLEIFSQEGGIKIPEVSKEAMKLLMDYLWPGNVRELKNYIERALVLGVGPILLPQHLPAEIGGSVQKAQDLSLTQAEKEHITRVLETTAWHKSKAAKILKMSRVTLDRKIKKYEIKRDIV
jgi:Nif-specific regulatory protein